MKKFFEVMFLMLVFGICYAVENQTWMKSGWYGTANTPSDTTYSVTSSTYAISPAVSQGALRLWQNIGTANVNFFYVLSSSQTYTQQKYLAPGQFYVEDIYFGTVYFMSNSGVNSVSETTFTNK